MEREQTLVLLKPDAMHRGLVGRIIQRFEDAGIKIASCKMVLASKKIASEHYGDLDARYSPEVKQQVVDFLTSGPIMAMVLEGVEVVEVVRKMVGSTDPKKAAPGTIRGDFGHMSMVFSKEQNLPLPNLIHASATKEEAEREVQLWFCTFECDHGPFGYNSWWHVPNYTEYTLDVPKERSNMA